MIRISFSIIVSALAVFIVIMLAGLGYTSTRPNVYESTARVWIQSKTAPQLIGESREVMYSPLTQFYSSPITTAAEVMRSKLVITKAHDALLKTMPAKQVPSISQMFTGFTVAPAKDADVLVVKYQDHDAKVVAPVVNAILDEFIAFNNTQHAGSATQSRISLADQVTSARAEYHQAKSELAAYQNSSKSVDMGLEVDNMIRVKEDMENELAIAKKNLSGLQSKIAYLQGQLGMSPEQAMAMQTLAEDDVLTGLRKKVAEDQVQLIDAKAKFRDEHPRVQQLNLSMSRSKTAMQERIKALLNGREASIGSELDISPNDPVKQQLIADIVRARSDELAETQGVAMMEQAILDQSAKLSALPDTRSRMSELERRVHLASEELNDAEKKLQNTKTLESVAYNSTNIQIIDRPETPTAPTSPNHNSDLLLSALFGVAGGGGTMLLGYLLDPRLYTAEEAIGMLSLSVIGWINQLQASARNISSIPGISRLHVALLGPIERGKKRIVIASASPGDGKTTIAAGLALSLSNSGLKVLLVDANLTRPALHELFGISAAPGLRDYLEAPAPATAQRMVRALNKNLMFMPAGRLDSQGPDLLSDPVFRQLLQEAQITPDVIVIDTAPTTTSANGLALYNDDSYLLVVVRLGHTLKNAIKDLGAQLRLRDVKDGSIVLTDASDQHVPSPQERPEISGEMSSAW